MKTMNLCHDFRYGKIIYNQMDLYVGKSLKFYGEYSQGEAELFDSIIRPDDWIIEGGANIGAHTVHLAQLVGDSGAVIAFEPQRLTFQLLAGNIAINNLTNVQCLHKCLSDESGFVNVPVLEPTQKNNFGALSLENNYPDGELVEVTTLDSFKFRRCDFIKLDVEGMELKVLKGAESLIEKFHPIIYVEANPGEKRPPLLAWIREHGYKIYPHVVPFYNPENFFRNPENIFGSCVSVNVLCVPAQRDWLEISGVEEIFS